MLERDIQKSIMAWLRSNGCHVVKYEGSIVGEPDLTASIPIGNGKSLSLYIEVKTETGRLSPIQKVRLNDLRAEGHLALMTRDVKSVGRYLRKNGVEISKPDKNPMYGRWKSMKSRCNNPKTDSYKHYGGRGITVCDRWQEVSMGYYNFIDDMGLPPFVGASIDRIDTDGNYEPSNCRWATPSQQANNRQENINLTVNGETKTLGEWSGISGISYTTLHTRLKLGWAPNDILSSGKLRVPQAIRCIETGEVYDNVKEASIALGVDPSGFFNILKGKQKVWGGYTWEYV